MVCGLWCVISSAFDQKHARGYFNKKRITWRNHINSFLIEVTQSWFVFGFAENFHCKAGLYTIFFLYFYSSLFNLLFIQLVSYSFIYLCKLLVQSCFVCNVSKLLLFFGDKCQLAHVEVQNDRMKRSLTTGFNQGIGS